LWVTFAVLFQSAVCRVQAVSAAIRRPHIIGGGVWKTLPRNPLTVIFGNIAAPPVAMPVALLLVAIALALSSLASFSGPMSHREGSSLRIEVDIVAIALFIFCWAPRFRCQARLSPQAPAEATECNSPRLNDAASRRRKLHSDRRSQLRQGLEQLNNIVMSLGDSASSDLELSLASCMPNRANVHDYHVLPPADLLLPVEVAACQFPLDVSEHLQRLLQDKWAVVNSSFACGGVLPSIPE
jgi:hypothetical protein